MSMRRYISTTQKYVGVSTLFLMAMFTIFSFAQTKPAPKAAASQTPQQYLIGVAHLQPGMAIEWQEFMRNQYIPAMKKGGVNRLSIWRTATFGESGEITITRPIEGLAELDAPTPIVKALGQDGSAALWAKAQRFVTSSRNFMCTSRSDLSIAPPSGYEFKLAYLIMASVAPGRTADYEKNHKEMLAVLGKTNAKGVLVNKVGFGGDPNEYRLLVLFDSFTDLGKFSAAFAKARDEMKLAPQTAGIVTHIEYRTIRYAPELSLQ